MVLLLVPPVRSGVRHDHEPRPLRGDHIEADMARSCGADLVLQPGILYESEEGFQVAPLGVPDTSAT
jgi:hypothetical protein